MFGREFLIILRNLSSIKPSLRDVNRNSGRKPYPENSVKNYMSEKIALRVIGSLDIMPRELRRRCHD